LIKQYDRHSIEMFSKRVAMF